MPRSRYGLLGRTRYRRYHRHAAMIANPVLWYAIRRAKIAFWAVGLVVAVTTAVIAASITEPFRATVIGLLTGIAVGLVVAAVLFAWPVIRVAWHWTTEILALAGLLTAYSALAAYLPWWLALATLIVPIGLLLTLPSIRRPVRGWVWCVVSRHRLRVCFTAFIASQQDGRTPLILLARPTPAGERIWIWLRPGLALSDLEARTDRLAAGCWAAECRITPASRRYAALLRIDIARRNPLMATIGSPLPNLVPATTTAKAYVAAPSGLDLPDIPDNAHAIDADRNRRAITAPAPPDTTAPVDDLSDWI
jgi:hypothetical protein